MLFSLLRSWCFVIFFFFKQKTAYEMRISDWSSDVCSSDLTAQDGLAAVAADADKGIELQPPVAFDDLSRAIDPAAIGQGIIKRVTLVGGAEDGAAAEQQGDVEEARHELTDVGVQRAQVGSAACREKECQYG